MINVYENDKVREAYAKVCCNESAENVKVNHKLASGSENPSVWIGTYGNYNEGNLYGVGDASGWIDLTTFDDAEDFHNWLNEQSGGRDVEWMFQDYQYFPESLYSESNIDGVWDYIDFRENSGLTDGQIDALLDNYKMDEIERFVKNGQLRIYNDCDSMSDVVQQIISDDGTDAFSEHTYRNAFDYEGFGRDIAMDWDSSSNNGKDAYETFGVDEDDDEALGEQYVDSVYGSIDSMTADELMRYIDYDAIGRDLEIDGTWIKTEDGDMIEVIW